MYVTNARKERTRTSPTRPSASAVHRTRARGDPHLPRPLTVKVSLESLPFQDFLCITRDWCGWVCLFGSEAVSTKRHWPGPEVLYCNVMWQSWNVDNGERNSPCPSFLVTDCFLPVCFFLLLTFFCVSNSSCQNSLFDAFTWSLLRVQSQGYQLILLSPLLFFFFA